MSGDRTVDRSWYVPYLTVHQMYQELALALQQNGTVQGKAKGKGGRGGRGGIGGRGRARRAARVPIARRAARATSGAV